MVCCKNGVIDENIHRILCLTYHDVWSLTTASLLQENITSSLIIVLFMLEFNAVLKRLLCS